jgi:hypothetical protein
LSLSIIACWDADSAVADVQRFLDELERTVVHADWEVYCVGPQPTGWRPDPRVENWHNTLAIDGMALNKCIMMSRSEYQVVVKPGLSLPKGWARWLSNHFRFNPEAGAVMALTRHHNYRMILDQVFQGIEFPDMQTISTALLDSMLGIGFEVQELSGSLIMSKKKIVLECGGFEGATVDESLKDFGQKLQAGNRTLIQAVDVFLY